VYAAAARVARAAAGGDVQPASNGSAAGTTTTSSTPPPATVVASRKEKVTFAADVFFSPRSNGIAGESATTLDDLARRVPAITLEVIIAVGHASTADGSAEASMQISKARAEAVKSFLVSRHPIEPRRIYTEGKGQSQPVADNATPEGRAKNQRVEIEVVGTRVSG
jgi:OOP family OmpA-OmpF porin